MSEQCESNISQARNHEPADDAFAVQHPTPDKQMQPECWCGTHATVDCGTSDSSRRGAKRKDERERAPPAESADRKAATIEARSTNSSGSGTGP
jgi:hypothetical protein